LPLLISGHAIYLTTNGTNGHESERLRRRDFAGLDS